MTNYVDEMPERVGHDGDEMPEHVGHDGEVIPENVGHDGASGGIMEVFKE